MSSEAYRDVSQQDEEIVRRRCQGDDVLVVELIKVLRPHPAGLRRWSVMRDIRKARERLSRDIPQKLEADIERAFRRLCTDDAGSRDDAIFYRPREKAGEVWASFPERAEAWLSGKIV